MRAGHESDLGELQSHFETVPQDEREEFVNLVVEMTRGDTRLDIDEVVGQFSEVAHKDRKRVAKRVREARAENPTEALERILNKLKFEFDNLNRLRKGHEAHSDFAELESHFRTVPSNERFDFVALVRDMTDGDVNADIDEVVGQFAEVPEQDRKRVAKRVIELKAENPQESVDRLINQLKSQR